MKPLIIQQLLRIKQNAAQLIADNFLNFYYIHLEILHSRVYYRIIKFQSATSGKGAVRNYSLQTLIIPKNLNLFVLNFTVTLPQYFVNISARSEFGWENLRVKNKSLNFLKREFITLYIQSFLTKLGKIKCINSLVQSVKKKKNK